MSARHRTPLRGGLRSYPNPSSSIDPRIRLVVARLSAMPAARIAVPDTFRSELRQQLVAITPRIVAESQAATASQLPALNRAGKAAPAAPQPGPGTAARRSLRRPVIALLAVTAFFVLLLGGALWRSGGTLPGDSLYSLKRAGENLQLSLLSGNAARGEKYLNLAGDRADEVRSLLSRDSATALGSGPQAAGVVSPHIAGLVTSTLDNEDSDVRDGTRLLTSNAASTGNVGPLNSMIVWSPSQLAKLNGIAGLLPAGQLYDRVLESVTTAQSALIRAVQIRAVAGSPCLASAPTDAYGPLPVTQCAIPAPSSTSSAAPAPGSPTSLPTPKIQVTPGSSSSPPSPISGATGTQGSSTPSNDTDSPSGSSPPEPTQSTSAPESGSTQATQSAVPTPPDVATLPGLPSVPVTISSCGVTITLLPLGSIDLGTCGPLISVGPTD
jgi:hypothetical protein